MEEHRRTRSQGPPSLTEGTGPRQWGSLPDPLQIEREHSEVIRLARQVNTVPNTSKSTVDKNEILQVTSEQTKYNEDTPQTDEILPNQWEDICVTRTMPIEGKISPNQPMPAMGEVPPGQPHEGRELKAMEEGAVANTSGRDSRSLQEQM